MVNFQDPKTKKMLMIGGVVLVVIIIIIVVAMSRSKSKSHADKAKAAAAQAQIHAKKATEQANIAKAASLKVSSAPSTVTPSTPTPTPTPAPAPTPTPSAINVYTLKGSSMGDLVGKTVSGSLTITIPHQNYGFYIKNDSSTTINSVEVSSPQLPSVGNDGIWVYSTLPGATWETYFTDFTAEISIAPGQGLIINDIQLVGGISTISFTFH